jgi:hypothetical protein
VRFLGLVFLELGLVKLDRVLVQSRFEQQLVIVPVADVLCLQHHSILAQERVFPVE